MTGTFSPPKQLRPEQVATRLPSLTGLRWVAAFAVWIYHSTQNVEKLTLFRDGHFNDRLHALALPGGGIGVQTFFVLSGFVLTWSARPGDTARAFWRRRLAKVYPNYLFTFALAALMYAAAITPLWVLLLNLAMLQPWVPDINAFFSVNMPSWSVGVEALFYASFPLLYAFLRRVPAERLRHWITGLVAANVAVPVLLSLSLPSSPHVITGPASELQLYLAYIFPPSRLLEFALGILVARAVQTGRWRDMGTLPAGLLMAASYVLAMFVPYLYGLRAVSVLPIALLIAAAANADLRGHRTVLRSRVMVWLGNISYAFYLSQLLVYMTVRFSLGPDTFSTPVSFGILAFDLALTLAVSTGMYYGIERPLMRRFARPRPRAGRSVTA
ncbi:acyltransferase [Kitasatospora sp. NPDC049285]|uniref:acyltransferase family protein n=1 Tax=Kitasatospora sp. NPDC049285 TaxID=3157096 RepID=UPI003432325F